MRTARPDGEHELDFRLRDRTIEDLNLRLRELTGLLRKEQATRELLSRQIAESRSTRVPKSRRSKATPAAKPAKRPATRKAKAKKRKSRRR